MEKLKAFLRRLALKKHRSTGSTSILPLSSIGSVVVLIEVDDPEFYSCKEEILAFFRSKGIKCEFVFFDFRKIVGDEMLVSSVNTTIYRKDLNWYGIPPYERISLLLASQSDLLITLSESQEFSIEYIARCLNTRCKVGRTEYPDHLYDIQLTCTEGTSQLAFFRAFKDLYSKIK